MNVFLIGYRGTGKTTVGRLLAARLDWPSVDADELLQQRAGQTIAEIFAREGEPAFRDRESEVLRELAFRKQHVISLGGGAVVRPANRNCLAGHRTVWLTAPAETLLERIEADRTTQAQRPNLTGGGLDEIRQLLEQRTPIYESCADLAIDTSQHGPEEVAEQIGQWLRELGL